MKKTSLARQAVKTAWNILPSSTTIRSYARNILAKVRDHDWRNNLPIWTSLSALCFSMILFLVAVKYVWGEMRNYESLRKQADLSESARQRYIRLAFTDSRKNPLLHPVVKHRRHRRGAKMIQQLNSAKSDVIETDVISSPPLPGSLDSDGDGLYDIEEEVLGTDWRRSDTDGDSINDYTELKMGLDPTSYDSIGNGVNSGKIDSNGDGSLQFGTFSYPSSGSRQKWNSPPHRIKRGKKRYVP